jgi:hypothetical protein
MLRLSESSALEEFINKAATEYADAIQLHGLDVWGRDQVGQGGDHDVDKMIAENKYKTKQIELIEEQMQIITIGWGHKDLAYKKNGSGCRCDMCGFKWKLGAAGEHEHRINHLKEALEEAWNRGRPEEPPLPVLTLKCKAPVVISTSPQEDGDAIMSKVMKDISKRAAKRVKAGKVRSNIVLLSEQQMPKCVRELKGRRIEYRCMIHRNADSTRREKYTYTGVVQSVQVRGSTKTNTVNGTTEWAVGSVASAIIAWDEADEEPSGIFLVPKLYGSDKEFGWLVLTGDEPGGDCELSVLEEHQQARIKAELTFCEGEM